MVFCDGFFACRDDLMSVRSVDAGGVCECNDELV